MESRLLGPLELRSGGEDVTPKAAKLRALLALLLLRANERVTSDELIEKLWDGKPPATAQNTLQHYVSELRKLLPDDTLVTQPPGYVLRVSPEQVDLQQFQRLATEGRQALAREDAQQAATLLNEALALWRGPALADFAYESWAQEEAQRLEELRLVALEDRTDAQLALGHADELAAELQTLVVQQPLRERLRAQLMLALYRSGRQAEALEAYQQTRETLVEELGIDPSPELQTLYKQILNQDEALAPPARAAERPRTNLPEPPTPLIGRARELEELKELLARPDVRLLTLTGPGGIGKTRLALQVATELLRDSPGGVYFVSLSPIRDPELLLPTIAQSVGVREQPSEPLAETLQGFLHERELLVVLDNLEQLISTAPTIGRLLASAPSLRVLATSREVLRIAGERVYAVPPLSLPRSDEVPELEQLGQYGSVALFLDRAQAVRRDFVATIENAQVIVEICARLDGLPLALELAAARIATLPPQALLGRLDRRLKLLTGGARDADERQQTLRRAIEWSYELLDPDEQALFARLSVFAGGCRLEAAETVCDPEGTLELDILDGIGSLLAKSLLRQREDHDGEPRFWMLETIREYAGERLEGSGEAETWRERHASYFVSLAEEAGPNLVGRDQSSWFARLEAENANLRASFETLTAAGDGERLASFAGSLWRFWYAHGHFREAKVRLEAALRAGAGAPPLVRARLLDGLAEILVATGDPERAEPLSDESLEIWRASGDRAALARALVTKQTVAYREGHEAWVAACEEGAAVAREVADTWALAVSLSNLGFARLEEGDNRQARELSTEAASLLAEVGDIFGAANSLANAGSAALADGLVDEAVEHYRESIRLAKQVGGGPIVAFTLEGLAAVALARRRTEAAVTLLGASGSLIEQLGFVGSARFEEERRKRTLAAAKEALDEERFLAALNAGASMTTDEAVDHALSNLEAPTATRS